jgi:hypothetical protein
LINYTKRLFIDNNRRVTFIFGNPSVIKAFYNGVYSNNIKLSFELATKLYKNFVLFGAEEIR